ncbi:39S ribosomal protein L41, mitochondrial [Copidosoma floridanum]|uniref:39S ribosomal protein L41, mitochondrial n=1 Tax=Copidosoma floridanum TaxID=29053 RepID=UPI0006C98ADD|nr:39S ribosomal protein L41, mitochondrial [Copidosoma floridanum]XP_023245655.1 39S ribosomal protein L41, mitochondrial [Copidosoma floridanum]XP_023245656.1 39S ribosomal protein L41, mitochondrial [Copidosoma floridanum]
MSGINLVFTRNVSTSCVRHGKRNFRKFDLINKRGSYEFKKAQVKNPDPKYPIDDRGTRKIGYFKGDKFIAIPEMIPELIVPNLEGFKLKPYVSYKSEDVYQEPFTAKDLFMAIYASKIKDDFDKGKLTPEGEPLEPNEAEKLTPKEARDLASKPGSDMFVAPPAPLGTIYNHDIKR